MMRNLWTWLLDSARRDWRTKLVALLVAVVGFQIIRANISEDETFRVRVVVTQPQEGGGVVVKVEPAEVRVSLKGSRDQLQSLREDSLIVKLTARQTGGVFGRGQNVALRRAHLEGAGYARVDSFDPKYVRLVYEKKGEQRLSVARPLLTGTPLVGTAEILWAETNVVVRGPQAQLKSMFENAVQLATEKIDVDGRVQSFTRRVRILPPPDVANVTVEPSEIDVRVGIKVETETQVFEEVPVRMTAVTGSGLILTSDPATVTVRITGMPERLRQVLKESISVIADCSNIQVDEEAEAVYPLRVFLSIGMDGLSSVAEPASATVRALRVRAPDRQPEAVDSAEVPTFIGPED